MVIHLNDAICVETARLRRFDIRSTAVQFRPHWYKNENQSTTTIKIYTTNVLHLDTYFLESAVNKYLWMKTLTYDIMINEYYLWCHIDHLWLEV